MTLIIPPGYFLEIRLTLYVIGSDGTKGVPRVLDI